MDGWMDGWMDTSSHYAFILCTSYKEGIRCVKCSARFFSCYAATEESV